MHNRRSRRQPLTATEAIALVGLIIVLGVFASYLAMLFVFRRFTYRTWIFHVVVLTGMILALIGAALGSSPGLALLVIVLGAAWYVVTWHELSIRGSHALKLRIGSQMPTFSAFSTDGQVVTERDLMAVAPTLLVLYRGWWCPSSKVQLDDVLSHYTELSGLGVKIFAGSVDGPEESAPMQDYVGSKVTILCSVATAFLDGIGIRDARGAPWYDRLRFGAAKRPISMPAAIALDPGGRVTFAERATRIDDRPSASRLLACVAAARSEGAAA